MSYDRDAEWAKFEEAGVDEVRKRLAMHQYAPGTVTANLAREFVEVYESKLLSDDSAKTAELAREANALAREANAVARDANALADKANSAASRAATAAEASAAEARRARWIATAALAIAIIPAMSSFIDWLTKK